MKSQIIKRSVMIDGHKTSISLEDAFWSSLMEIAHAEGATMSELVAKIDKTRKQGKHGSDLARCLLLTPSGHRICRMSKHNVSVPTPHNRLTLDA